jgi:hypothetical protein
MMKILDIKHTSTGETRTDGRYPLRIGSQVEFFTDPVVGYCCVFEYVTDNCGNPKEGALRTSIVEGVQKTDDKIIITTMNSIYILSREDN